MYFSDKPIDAYPKLKQWLLKSQTAVPSSVAECFLLKLCQAMSFQGRESSRIWISATEAFLRNSENPLRDFVDLDSISQEFNAPSSELFGTLCENSVKIGDGFKAQSVIKSLASRTNLSGIRFLSAWIAFNIGDLQSCIDECEKELSPNAPLYTVLGQAYLDSGNPTEAIVALKVASTVAPNDPLPLFQLVKCYMVTEDVKNAIDAIEKCRLLCGTNIEVECLSALIALMDVPSNRIFAENTAERLKHLFDSDPGNIDLLCLGYDVMESLNDQNSIAALFSKADFSKISNTNSFDSKITLLLRKTGEKGWFGLAKILTENLITQRSLRNTH